MPVKSTLTLAQIDKNPTKWTNLSGPLIRKDLGGEEFNHLGGGNLKVDSSKSGMLILDGLTYLKSNAHLSITGSDTGEWTYFHLTLVGSEGKSAYFLLDTAYDPEEEETKLVAKTTAYTVIKGSKVNVGSAQYYWSSPPAELVSDLTLLMKGLVGKSYTAGEAV